MAASPHLRYQVIQIYKGMSSHRALEEESIELTNYSQSCFTWEGNIQEDTITSDLVCTRPSRVRPVSQMKPRSKRALRKRNM